MSDAEAIGLSLLSARVELTGRMIQLGATSRWSMTDAHSLDRNPDLCWRCDARAATNDLGLCEPCREVLR